MGLSAQFTTNPIGGGEGSYIQKVLLPNGKVLFWSTSGACRLLEMNDSGTYAHDNHRRVQDMPYSNYANHAVVRANGKVLFLIGEYGTSIAAKALQEFDPVTESWDVHINNAFGNSNHGDQAVMLFPNGQIRLRQATLSPTGVLSSATTHNDLVFQGPAGDILFQTMEEEGCAFGPAGEFSWLSDNAMFVNYTNNKFPRLRRMSSGGGSINWGTPTFVKSGWWKTPSDATGSHIVSPGRINYEIGGCMWHPHRNEFLFASGDGGIYGFPESGNTVTLRAELPMDGFDGTFRTPQIGVVSNGAGQTMPNHLTSTGGTFTFSAATQNFRSDIFPSLNSVMTNADARVVADRVAYVLIDSGRKWICIKYTGYTISGVNVTLTGVTIPTLPSTRAPRNDVYYFPGATTFQMQSGDKIFLSRPSYDSRDGCIGVLPNGDVLIRAGLDDDIYPGVGDFNKRSTLLKWNGTTFTAIDEYPGQNDIWGPIINLPNGEVLLSNYGQYRIWTPDNNEMVPYNNIRPVITSMPGQAYAGGTFTISGTALNGLHVGTGQNDDVEVWTHFPIVKFTPIGTGKTYYGDLVSIPYRGIGNTSQSVVVKVPSDIPQGTYKTSVVASGIESIQQNVTVFATVGEAINVGWYN